MNNMFSNPKICNPLFDTLCRIKTEPVQKMIMLLSFRLICKDMKYIDPLLKRVLEQEWLLHNLEFTMNTPVCMISARDTVTMRVVHMLELLIEHQEICQENENLKHWITYAHDLCIYPLLTDPLFTSKASLFLKRFQ